MKSKSYIYPKSPLKTPVLFLVFNRLKPTRVVFERISAAKPPRLYIASDGPRLGVANEKIVIDEIRDYLLSNISWNCEVKTLFREENLGCMMAVSDAISWFFNNEEQGIILEDDCLPSLSFFWYCEMLLDKYKLDFNVCSISGNLRNVDMVDSHQNLYKSRYFNMWGWATWRRQWNNYDMNFFVNKSERDFNLKDLFTNKRERCYWSIIINDMINQKINTWDYQLLISAIINKQVNIYPRYNLVKNIGFDMDATHTFNPKSSHSKVQNYDFWIEDANIELQDIPDIDHLFLKEYSCKSSLKKMLFLVSKIFQRMFVL